MLDGQRQAGQDGLTVDQDSARATLAELTTVLGAGQVEVFAQDFEQRLVDGDKKRVLFAVDVEDQRQALRRVWHVLPTQRRIVRDILRRSGPCGWLYPGGDPVGGFTLEGTLRVALPRRGPLQV